MASKLCCTAEQEAKPDSPELPNVRIADATPVKLPLLPKQTGSTNSRFTSVRSEDLHELRQIFDNADENEPTRLPPPKGLGRTHFNKPSIYSLHSLHKMKSMRSLIRRKFSRDLSKKPSVDQVQSADATDSATPAGPGTVIKQQKGGLNPQLKITKDNLRKDLLSDKKPDEGGYDSDAQVLDDIAKNIGKKTPNKRPSIHSIDWTTTTASKTTPESSSKSHQSLERTRDIQQYHIKPHQSVSLSGRFSQVFRTPNLQVDNSRTQGRTLRRPHSATSTRLPEYSPLSPLRLPSLKAHDNDGVPWSVALNESLGLSQFPFPSRGVTPKQSSASLKRHTSSKGVISKPQLQENAVSREPHDKEEEVLAPTSVVQIRVQEPTATATPRESASIKGSSRDNPPQARQEATKEEDETEEGQPRQSLHLYSMRISHHLRFGSVLSWDTLADASELPAPPGNLRERSFSDLSKTSQTQQQLSRHERQKSSSGFTSSRVPSKWGKVVSNDIREDKSSIYSSRPQSRPESFGGSMVNLSPTSPRHGLSKHPSVDLTKLRRSNSYPTDNDDTPRPAQRHGLANLRDVTSYSVLARRSNETPRLVCNNSVASTKKSKFREEFSPSPPRKKLMPSTSIMRFFNPKRNGTRSQSEANIMPESHVLTVDGSLEVPGSATQRERRQSRSIASLEAEQKALGKDKKASPLWDRALKAHQDERAAMFLPENKDLATHVGPFRERSGSTASTVRLRPSEDSATLRKLSNPKRFSGPLLDPPTPDAGGKQEPFPIFNRRTALAGRDPSDSDARHEAQIRFNQQTDTADTVGAWGRYPSYSRHDRTSPAGHLDRVDTRDFALEAAIKFAMGKDNNGEDEDMVDPTARPVTPPLIPGQKKRKKKLGNTRMAKSHSMTFGKSFLKNYTKIFRSQSIEYHRHGKGHRSSISTGGTLEYPELEILPDVWRCGIIEEKSGESGQDGGVNSTTQEEYGPGDKKGKGKMKEEDSSSTLRPLAASLRPTGNLLVGLDGTRDTARTWSAYYENCLPSFPRASTELDLSLKDFGAPVRHSFDSRCGSMLSRSVPGRNTKHSRNASCISALSGASNGSAQASFLSTVETDGVDKRSMVSVRRSTMDLVTMYKEQENTEREKVLRLMRVESVKENAAMKGL